MKLNRFRIQVAARVVLISLTILAAVPLVTTRNTLLLVLTAAAAVYQVCRLIRFVEKTNRDLSRFFQSIVHDDFSQTFTGGKLGPSFDELNRSFGQVTRMFLDLRSEKEEHFRHLQTVVQHVGVGVVSFKPDGTIQLMNNAAKRLLHVEHLRNLKGLETVSPKLFHALKDLKPGRNSLVRNGTTTHSRTLALRATQFILRSERYTLVCLHDIESEIERERMARELEIASHVQRSLFPSEVPQLRGFSLAAHCLPAREVGGDYFDFIRLGEDRLAVVIGDVSGKGVPASFYMTLTKGYLQSHMNGNTPPREILSGLNNFLVKNMESGFFMTMFLAILDGRTRRVTCARAGHVPALMYRAAGGQFESVAPDGLVLGFQEDGRFSSLLTEHELQMEPGDWLVMSTDGITEAMNGSEEEFGDGEMMRVVEAHRERSATEMVQALIAGVDCFIQPNPPFDDMTLIGIKAVATEDARSQS